MAAYTILMAATEDTTVEAVFNFPSGTIEVEINDVSDGFLTSGVESSIGLSNGDKLEFICSNWDVITVINFSGEKVSGDVSGWTLPTGLINLDLSNTDVSGSIASWVLPSSLTDIQLDQSDVSGSVASWVLPIALENIRLGLSVISGDVSSWVLPDDLDYFSIADSSISGDIGGWVLPDDLTDFRIDGSNVSGDVSSWVLNSKLDDFYADSTGISGDISGWTLPANLSHLSLSNTNVSGDISGWTSPNDIRTFEFNDTTVGYSSSSGILVGIVSSSANVNFNNCALTYQEVDNVLADLVTSGVSNGTLDIGGTSSGNSPAGAADRTLLDITRSWHVTINAEVTPPTQASSPSPADDAVDVAVDATLSWIKDVGDTVFVYLDKKSEHDPPTTKVVDDVDQLLYDPPGDLDSNTTYVWRVDTKTGVGTEVGNQWEFTTVAADGDSELSYSRGLRGIGFGMNRGVV